MVALGGTPGTLAAFTDRASIAAGPAAAPTTAFTAGTIATPVSPTAGQTAASTVTLTWTATSIGSNGGTAPAYDVLRFGTATGGTATVVCAGVPALNCVDSAAPSGTSYYVLRARVGSNWFKDSPRVAVTADTVAPTVSITNPLDGCSGTVVACGTAADSGSGVAKVEYTFRRTRTFFLGGQPTYSCWNGNAWAAANADNSCTFANTTGTTAWQVPGVKNTAYADVFLYTLTYTLTVRATDAVGNVSANATATFS